MKWSVRIIQGVLVVGFLLFGFMKLSADPTMVDSFENVYGYGTGFMYFVGTIEVVAAIGLLIGYWKKKLIPVFSGLLVLVMAGAVLTHLNAGQGMAVAMTPLILLVLAAFVFVGQKKVNNGANQSAEQIS
ncbi:MAG: DoxX family protein [Exiguobacterium oxidotolerans]|uniref:DoxX family protein n=1 Tax=unclassified Exiguobacterium TaxID=2644629 RepID=UPI001BE8056E|nr:MULTISPECIES: DoxX family protein [unclassified Exiguobacterium]